MKWIQLGHSASGPVCSTRDAYVKAHANLHLESESEDDEPESDASSGA